MTDLRIRAFDAEIMDDFDLPVSEIAPVLAGLGKVNAWFGGHKKLIKALKKFPVRSGYSVSDWGCGGGDALIAIDKWAARNKLPLKLTGLDAAPAAITFARQESAGFYNINYLLTDVIADSNINCYDIIISSLFTHHFNDEHWIQLIKNMQSSARKGIIITDLHRHWLLYYAVIAITHIFTRNKMVRNDGPLSVKRAFKKHELVTLLKNAEIDNYNLTWHWPFRWQLIIYKS
ncbi:methyltransferase domain-containing protein [Mucilaginibacter sp. SP1R1]|uniref:methyltransferase domain-containing protein n=1 Tax=Mucilaginibacter sp. SP1R1 TaxID=2723091 RepID=UPI001608C737|nr:methyltransferase domain-containing protein [Mucilaginibacter sp. SP1R1]MBB6152317.1 2-polyprenyl-3-methyl-5-hydroxy-6-metoxy-1,4-benzoquinol methylase [Mucilaginibacter sp. SP1R1]